MSTTARRTPAQLGITNEEFDGLIKIAEHFRTADAPPHVKEHEVGKAVFHPPHTSLGFNMGQSVGHVSRSAPARRQYDCGSTACIGGHLSLHLQGVNVLVPAGTPITFTGKQMALADEFTFNPGAFQRENQGSHRSQSLHDLFFPNSLSYYDWDKITPRIAARAIENFLHHGRPRWRSLVDPSDEGDGD